MSPFEPPHLDSVTGLAIAGNKVISASKDKHLRLWDTNHTINNNKHTFHAFNDYVTTVQSKIFITKVLQTVLFSMQDPKMDK